MRSRLLIASILATGLYGLDAPFGGYSLRGPKEPKYPFTDEEKSILEKLQGTDKKRYLKTLKEKYRKS